MDIKVLREEFASLHTECNSVLSKVAAEKRGFSAEEKEQQDRRFARLGDIKEQMSQFDALASQAVHVSNNTDYGMKPKAQVEFDKPMSVGDQIKYWALNGATRENFTVISTNQNSIILPVNVMSPVIVRRNANAFRQALVKTGYNPIYNETVSQFNLPVWDDTAYTGEQASEGGTTDDQQDTDQSGSLVLNSTLWEGKNRWFSNTSLATNSFDPTVTAIPVLHQMVEKARESAATTVAQALTKNLYTTASSAVFAYADLIAWEHTLPVAFRSDSVFIVSDNLYKTMRGLVDNNLRPIIDLAPGDTWTETIHGKPLVVSDYFSAVGSSAKAGLYCSGQGIVVYDAGPARLTRYVNIPTEPDNTGFNLFQNGDINFIGQYCSPLKIHA